MALWHLSSRWIYEVGQAILQVVPVMDRKIAFWLMFVDDPVPVSSREESFGQA